MQAVADLKLLHLAQKGVELGQRVVRVVRYREAAVPIEPEIRRSRQDLLAQQLRAARVEAFRLGVLIDQRLDLAQRSRPLGPGERRGEVVDDDGRGAPLGRRALAGIVDDERIDVGQGTERDLRKALLRQRQCLARQPFQIAVFADVHDRMRPERFAQPAVEGQMPVRRGEVGVVVRRLRVDVEAARRLHAQHEVVVAAQRETEPARASIEARIILRGAPAAENPLARRRRNA